MAESKLVLTLVWENRKLFKLTEKFNDTSPIVIVEVNENGDLPILWAGVEGICKIYFQSKIEMIGKEMKAP